MMTLYALGLVASNIVAVKLSEKLGVKNHCAVFILVYSFGLYYISITKSYSIGIFVIVIAGACYGMVNVVTQRAGWEYYPDHQGFVTGFLLSSHGFMGVTINYILFIMMNPENIKPTKDTNATGNDRYFPPKVYLRFPHTMQVLGIGSLIIWPSTCGFIPRLDSEIALSITFKILVSHTCIVNILESGDDMFPN